MKTMKKILALLITVVMALGTLTSVFAEGNPDPAEPTTYSITIDNTKSGHTYQVYQIFAGELTEKDNELINIVWGDGVTAAGQTALGNAAEKASSLSGAADADAFAKELVAGGYLTNPTTITNGDNGYTANVAPGYYLIKDNEAVTLGEADAYTSYIVEVVGPTTVEPKGTVPEPTKKIVEGSEKVDANSASIGQKVNYEVTGTMPSNISDYNTYFYQFTDTMSPGLTYNKDMKVMIGTTDVTKYFYKSSSIAEDGKTTIVTSIQDIKALGLIEGITIDSTTKVVLTYSATLNEKAEIGGAEGNPNDVDITYSNDPHNSGDPTTEPPGENPPGENPPEDNPPTPKHPAGETPKQTVKTYTTELTITKIDGANGNILTGAGFTLTSTDGSVVLTKVTREVFTKSTDGTGTYYKLNDGTYTTTPPVTEGPTANVADYVSTESYVKEIQESWEGKKANTTTNVTGMVGDDGKLTFTGLGAGSYTLTESITPDGYNTIEPINFKVSFDKAKATFGSEYPISVNGENKLETEIENNSGSTLPSTGGIGTTIFYTLGGVLVVAAAVLLITKRRVASL